MAGTPQPQPQPQPPHQPPPPSTSGGGTFRALAHYCWIAVPVSIFTNITVGKALMSTPSKEVSLGVAITLGGIWLSGILSGLIALFGIRRHGRKGILVPALVGLSLWVLMIALVVLLVLALPTFKEIQERAARMKTPASEAPATTSSDSTSTSVSTTPSSPVNPPGATRVEDRESGFSFSIPEGYTASSEKGPDDRHAFQRKLITEPARGILIKRMAGDYSRRIATAADFPPAPRGQTVTSIIFNWRGRDVGGTRSLDPRSAQPYVVFKIVIPLRKETILLEVGGAQESEPVIREVVEQVLASLEEE